MVRHAAWAGCGLACLLGVIACTPGPAPAAPANAPGQSLYLVRYEIAPGTALRRTIMKAPRSAWSRQAS